MSIIRRAISGTRALTPNQAFVTGTSWNETKVNQDSALGIAAVYAAIRLYADTVASLPVGAYVRVNGERRPYFPRPAWLDNPVPQNPNYTGFDLRHRIVTSLLTDGNAFLLTIRDPRGEITEVHALDPRNVEVGMNADRSPYYNVLGGAGATRLTADEIVHLTLFATGDNQRGMSPIQHHARTLGIAIAGEQFASKFFEQGATVGGVVEVPGELSPEQAAEIREGFAGRHEGVAKAHRIAVLSGGAKFETLPIKVSELALVEQLGWTVEQVARIYAVPLALLSVSTPGAQSYASVEAQLSAWLRTGLYPLIVRIEAGLQRLVVGDTTFIKFNVDALLRPTTLERYQAHAVAITNGWASPNDVRKLEDQVPYEGGDEYLRPLNLAPVAIAETQAQATLYATLITAGIDPAEAKRLSGL
jgi:HK97 family phage portal protein